MDIKTKKLSIEQEYQKVINEINQHNQQINQLIQKRDNLAGQYQLITELEKEASQPQGVQIPVVDERIKK